MNTTSTCRLLLRSLAVIAVLLIVTTSARPASSAPSSSQGRRHHTARYVPRTEHNPNHIRRSIRKRQAENVVHAELARKLAELQRLAKLARLMPGSDFKQQNRMRIQALPPYYRRKILRILRRYHRRSS